MIKLLASGERPTAPRTTLTRTRIHSHRIILDHRHCRHHNLRSRPASDGLATNHRPEPTLTHGAAACRFSRSPDVALLQALVGFALDRLMARRAPRGRARRAGLEAASCGTFSDRRWFGFRVYYESQRLAVALESGGPRRRDSGSPDFAEDPSAHPRLASPGRAGPPTPDGLRGQPAGPFHLRLQQRHDGNPRDDHGEAAAHAQIS